MVQFIKKHWRKILLLLLLLLLLFFGLRALGERSVIVGNPDNIVVISPDESQDVIVIGDPEEVKVKPKLKH